MAKIQDVSAGQSEPLLMSCPWQKYGGKKAKQDHQIVKALYRMIELKDAKTASHCKGVAFYSRALGIELGLNEKELEILWDAALIHDIGKIMVDNLIIYKKEKLTDNDLMLLRSHAVKGMQMTEPFHLNDSIVDAAWHHHERWDGTGYPDSLKGQEIRFMTQIISAADITDAMSTNRMYRKALSFDEIMRELDEANGTQINPEIAEVMIRMLQDNDITLLG